MPAGKGWRAFVFKNRGALLVPVALVLAVFGKPSAHSAGIGIGIAALGEALRVWAVGFSGTTTRADIVTAPALVTAGPYAAMRNPLYLANAIIALGFWAAFSGELDSLERTVLLIVVLGLVVAVYGAIIPLEEDFLAKVFGGKFARYCEKVPRFLPTGRVMPVSERRGAWHVAVILKAEIITLAFFAVMSAIALWRAT